MHHCEPEVINMVIITVHVSNITLEYRKHGGVHTKDTEQVGNFCLLMSNLGIRILCFHYYAASKLLGEILR
jgi:hypothetical protein